MDWVCTPSQHIDLLASFFMFGLGIGAFSISWLPEKFGRKNTLMYTGIVTTLAQFFLLYWPSYPVRLASMGTIGVFYINKSVCFNMMYELTEKKYTPPICTLFCIFDWLSYAVICAYMAVYREWMPIFSMYTYVGLVCLLV